ncbi:MAG TPA: hypothetical protein VIZ28_02225 [Chitinophagaceae bacterium]
MPGQRTAKSWRLLFAGNSLTYFNDLPAMITEMAKQDGVTITYTSFLFPNYALEDHWNEGKVQSELEKGGYDFMVAQQGPSGAPESQVLLLDYAKKYAGECNKNKSKLALYMVWPSKARSFDHDNVINSYTNAATKTASLLCPAGLAWKYAWQTDPELPLYSPDNFHPSTTGSVLAALTIYGSLAGKKNFDFIQYENCSWKNEISKDRLNVLVQAAVKALSK